mgnify:CR=1 FL=1
MLYKKHQVWTAQKTDCNKLNASLLLETLEHAYNIYPCNNSFWNHKTEYLRDKNVKKGQVSAVSPVEIVSAWNEPFTNHIIKGLSAEAERRFRKYSLPDSLNAWHVYRDEKETLDFGYGAGC